jgi:hypothetical protein
MKPSDWFFIRFEMLLETGPNLILALIHQRSF